MRCSTDFSPEMCMHLKQSKKLYGKWTIKEASFHPSHLLCYQAIHLPKQQLIFNQYIDFLGYFILKDHIFL